jgi:phage-related protein
VPGEAKPVRWVASSRRDLKTFPKAVRRDIGQALYAAQQGEEYPSVKALKGFGGRSVLEIVAPYRTDAYRAVYRCGFTLRSTYCTRSRKSLRTGS